METISVLKYEVWQKLQRVRESLERDLQGQAGVLVRITWSSDIINYLMEPPCNWDHPVRGRFLLVVQVDVRAMAINRLQTAKEREAAECRLVNIPHLHLPLITLMVSLLQTPSHHRLPNHNSWSSWGFNYSAILLLLRSTADPQPTVLYSRQGTLSSFCWDSPIQKANISDCSVSEENRRWCQKIDD